MHGWWKHKKRYSKTSAQRTVTGLHVSLRGVSPFHPLCFPVRALKINIWFDRDLFPTCLILWSTLRSCGEEGCCTTGLRSCLNALFPWCCLRVQQRYLNWLVQPVPRGDSPSIVLIPGSTPLWSFLSLRFTVCSRTSSSNATVFTLPLSFLTDRLSVACTSPYTLSASRALVQHFVHHLQHPAPTPPGFLTSAVQLQLLHCKLCWSDPPASLLLFPFFHSIKVKLLILGSKFEELPSFLHHFCSLLPLLH